MPGAATASAGDLGGLVRREPAPGQPLRRRRADSIRSTSTPTARSAATATSDGFGRAREAEFEAGVAAQPGLAVAGRRRSATQPDPNRRTRPRISRSTARPAAKRDSPAVTLVAARQTWITPALDHALKVTLDHAARRPSGGHRPGAERRQHPRRSLERRRRAGCAQPARRRSAFGGSPSWAASTSHAPDTGGHARNATSIAKRIPTVWTERAARDQERPLPGGRPASPASPSEAARRAARDPGIEPSGALRRQPYDMCEPKPPHFKERPATPENDRGRAKHLSGGRAEGRTRP